MFSLGNWYQTFAVCTDDEARALLPAIEMPARDPARPARYFGRDSQGRSIPWMEAGTLLAGYFVDHAEKHIFILEIRCARKARLNAGESPAGAIREALI